MATEYVLVFTLYAICIYHCQSYISIVNKMTQLETIQKPKIVGVRKFTCTNHVVHNVKVIKYDDESTWVMCPLFGWYSEAKHGESKLKLGCMERKKRCTWFITTH